MKDEGASGLGLVPSSVFFRQTQGFFFRSSFIIHRSFDSRRSTPDSRLPFPMRYFRMIHVPSNVITQRMTMLCAQNSDRKSTSDPSGGTPGWRFRMVGNANRIVAM